MATEYTITYTYKGQTNTSGTRSVALSSFTKSGDTGRKIGEITSIKYVHYHTSDKPMTWNLRGRLVFSDGSTITSPSVGKHISGSVVKYTHTFTDLPTAEKFATLTSVQTLDSEGKTTAGGYSARLYWRATKDYPMQITVTFTEKQSVVYAPKIDVFEVTRCDDKGDTQNPEGKCISTSMRISIGNTAGLSGAKLIVYYAANTPPVIGGSQSVDLTSRISELRTGVTNSTTLLPGEWGAEHQWFFVAVFTAGAESDSLGRTVSRGSVSFHVSDKRGGGAAVGGFCTGTYENPKFESFVPARMLGGIEGVTNYVLGETDTGGRWYESGEGWKAGKPIYRYIWKGKIAFDTDQQTVTSLPSTPDMVLSLRAMIKRPSDNAWMPVPNAYYNSMNYMLNIRTDGSKGIVVGVGSSVTGSKDIIVIAEYTKA